MKKSTLVLMILLSQFFVACGDGDSTTGPDSGQTPTRPGTSTGSGMAKHPCEDVISAETFVERLDVTDTIFSVDTIQYESKMCQYFAMDGGLLSHSDMSWRFQAGPRLSALRSDYMTYDKKGTDKQGRLCVEESLGDMSMLFLLEDHKVGKYDGMRLWFAEDDCKASDLPMQLWVDCNGATFVVQVQSPRHTDEELMLEADWVAQQVCAHP